MPNFDNYLFLIEDDNLFNADIILINYIYKEK